jgi:hypothetical protein
MMNRGVEESVYRRWAPLGKRALRKLMIIGVLLLATVFIGQWYRLRYEDTYITRLPHGAFELALFEDGGINLFAVSADGLSFYLHDVRNLLIVDRQTNRLTRMQMPIPLEGTDIGSGGLVVIVGMCQEIEPISNIDLSESWKTETARRIWVVRSDGTIDKARTEGFNRALNQFFQKHPLGDAVCFTQVCFFTSTRLGLRIAPPVLLKGSAVIPKHMGKLLVLRDDGGYEEPLYAWAASNDGNLLLEDTRFIGLEAQKKGTHKNFFSDNLVEYVILERDGTEYRRDQALAYPREPVPMRRIQLDKNIRTDLTLQIQDLHKEGVILFADGARLDSQGRLYLPGTTTKRRLHSVWLPGRRDRLELLDGYVIARFMPDGRFDRIVARLKMPTYRCHRHQLWDIDSAGNLYYLEFGSKGVGIRVVKGE